MKKTKNAFFSIEYLIIFVFIASTIVWTVSKCSKTREEYRLEKWQSTLEEKEKAIKKANLRSQIPIDQPSQPSIIAQPQVTAAGGKVVNLAEPVKNGEKVSNLPAPPIIQEQQVTAAVGPVQYKVASRLYVVLDGLKVRANSNLTGEILKKLELFEEVYFMDQVSERRDSINIGKITTYEPWIRIKTKEGLEGWVYGAGVNYYRQKHPGSD